MPIGETIRIGLLFSTTGPYKTIGRAMRNGAQLAVKEVNFDEIFPFVIETVAADPGGDDAQYAQAAQNMLTRDGLAHVVGCYTSSSRKEVLPFFEKYDGLLLYPSHYEGFESSEHVIYTGAAPNQHIVPLTEHILRTYGKTAYCIGSNYIRAWENNKIMREAVLGNGGTVLAERYFPVGETDFQAVIEQILNYGPSFVFNTLIGVSAYEFFRAFRRAACARGIDQAAELPVASCSLAEPELVEIGRESCAGHLSSSVYFESIGSTRNRALVNAYRKRFPEAGPTSADVESSYLAVHFLARAIRSARSADMLVARTALEQIEIDAPQGRVSINGTNRHCYLTPRIGISNTEAGFDIIYEAPCPVAPDPYLVWQNANRHMAAERPSLRLIR
jgi:ABC-type branched-subunit amino acid transport system substrate-binding protein